MINVNEPLELDDGRTARYVSPEEAEERNLLFGEPYGFDEGLILVEYAGPYRRGDLDKDTNTWWYSLEGIWDGGSAAEHYVVCNVANEEDYVSDF